MVHGFHSYINFPEGKPWQAVLRVLKYRGESWAVLIIIVLIQPVMKYTVYWLVYPYDWDDVK